MSGHVFVDDLGDARRAVRALVMPGQRRLHMKKESRARRSAIIDAIMATGATASVYQTWRSGRHELAARAACLRTVIADAAAAGHGMLTFEQDDSLLWCDRQRLVEITREVGCRDTLRYEHRRAEHELLLAVPDAIAWCWAKGGSWRDRIQPLVERARTI